jgi:hypothetical protein
VNLQWQHGDVTAVDLPAASVDVVHTERVLIYVEAEAAMLTACMVGQRFGIVTFSAGLVPWFRECVRTHGLEDRLAGIRSSTAPLGPLASIAADQREPLPVAALPPSSSTAPTS